MVTTKPGRQGERGISRKPLCRECRSCSGSPVVLPPCLLCCTGPMGAIGTRYSLRPPFPEGNVLANLGRNAPRERDVAHRLCRVTLYRVGKATTSSVARQTKAEAC